MSALNSHVVQFPEMSHALRHALAHVTDDVVTGENAVSIIYADLAVYDATNLIIYDYTVY